jgi:hypothetical protein
MISRKSAVIDQIGAVRPIEAGGTWTAALDALEILIEVSNSGCLMQADLLQAKSRDRQQNAVVFDVRYQIVASR